MVDTSYLTTTVEEYIRSELGYQYRLKFMKRELLLKTGGTKKFSAVSNDQSIVVEIMSASASTRNKKDPAGKINAAVAAIYFLSLTSARIQILILTDPEFYKIFMDKMEGKIVKGVEVMHIPLPKHMARKVQQIRKQASIEVQPREL